MSPTAAAGLLPGQEAIVEIRTTFPQRPGAEACATRLVEGRLAACVQIDGPIASVYRWQGTVETAEEFRCTCKTVVERLPECIAAISEIHPYDTPELIVTSALASPAYAEWVRESVNPK